MVKKNQGKKNKTEVVTETERELYNLKFLDTEKKIERLKNRNDELNTRIEDLKEMSARIDQEKGDIIAAIKKELKRKKDECEELHERILGLNKAKEEDEVSFTRECYKLERRFQATHEQMIGEIKLKSGNLYTLEEFKSKREELNNKFKKRKQEMLNKENEHQKALKEVESKFIKARNRLKQTFEKQIFKLSNEFHKITEKRITPTTHRTIRVNITIKTEMESLEMICETMAQENLELYDNAQLSKKKIDMYEEKIETTTAKMSIHNKLLDIAKKKHSEFTEKLNDENERKKQFDIKLSSFEKILKTLKKVAHTKGIVKQHLEALNIENKDLKHQMNVAVDKWNDLMKAILKSTAYIKHIIHIDDNQFYNEIWFFKSYDDKRFLENILEMLLKAKTDDTETESSDYWEPPIEIRSSAGKHLAIEDIMSQMSSLFDYEFLEEESEYTESEIILSLKSKMLIEEEQEQDFGALDNLEVYSDHLSSEENFFDEEEEFEEENKKVDD